MTIQDVLSQINTLPEVSGALLCTLSGKLIAENMPNYQTEYRKKLLSNKMRELVRQFHGNEEDFLEINGAGNENKWIAKKYKNVVLIVLLYPGADPYLIKLSMDVALHELKKDKKILKILSGEITVLISMLKQIHVLDIFQFQENLKKEGIKRGIIITKSPYDNKVKNELSKHGSRIEIVISNKMKKELKNLTKRLEEHGYKVKQRMLITGRGM